MDEEYYGLLETEASQGILEAVQAPIKEPPGGRSPEGPLSRRVDDGGVWEHASHTIIT